MKRKMEATGSRTDHVSNEKVLRRNENKGHILRIREKQLKFFGCIIRKESLENVTLTRYIESKGNREVS